MRVRRKKRTKRLIVLLSLLLLGIVGFRNILPNLGDVFQYHHVASGEYGWNLILVNRDNYIPDDYTVELTELSNGQKVDSRIYPSLQKMFDAARAEGLGLFVADGYRTAETQQQILEGKIEAYKNEGYSSEEAEKKAKEWVAVPGTSEHQLGLAVDINADKSQSTSEAKAFSEGKTFSLCRLESTMIIVASSSVRFRTIQGMTAFPASSLANFLRCPATIS